MVEDVNIVVNLEMLAYCTGFAAKVIRQDIAFFA